MSGKLTQKNKSYQDFLHDSNRVKEGEDKGFSCWLDVAQSEDWVCRDQNVSDKVLCAG